LHDADILPIFDDAHRLTTMIYSRHYQWQLTIRTHCDSVGLSFSDQISTLSQSCYYHIRQLRCIRSYLDFKTASSIATSIVHSTFDYCNSLYYNLPKSQITRPQQIQNSFARVVVKAPKFCHITPSYTLFNGSK